MITGIDALLAKYARQFPHNSNGGGTITVQLIKGPSSSSVDPIAARRAAALHAKRMAASSEANTAASSGGGGMSYSNSSGAEETSDDGGGGRASNLGAAAAVVELKFPRLAKFVDTVTPPNFNTMLKDGRMYEEEVPKAKVSTIDKIPDIYQLCSCCMNTLCVYFLGELMLMMMMMMMMHVSYFWHMNIFNHLSRLFACHRNAVLCTECLFQREAFVSGRNALCSHSIRPLEDSPHIRIYFITETILTFL